MRHLIRCCVLLAVLALPMLCAAQQLTVSAAASLTEAFREIGARFEATRPGVTVRFNFAASGVLVQQIAQGAPVDLLVSADQDTMDRAASQRLIDAATRRNFAANTLVLVEPAQGGQGLTSLPDLARTAVRKIAVGKLATVPVGRYTRQALESARLWERLEPKLVFADSVRQVLDYVARGEVEAGFVYRTDATLMADRVRVVMVVPGHAPVTYPLAVVSDSRHKALAGELAAFISSTSGQQVLARHGFGKP